MNVPTAPAASEAVVHLFLYLILKFSVALPSFTTTSTFFPEGVRKATLGKDDVVVLAIRTEPAGTNFEACAII